MKAWGAFALAAVVVVADQLTKLALVAWLPYGAEVDLLPGWVRLVHTRNRGVAFGMFDSPAAWMDGLRLAVVVAVAAFVVWQIVAGARGTILIGLALVLGGAVGNLIDRLVRGEVVDYLDAFAVWGGCEHHWPAFNVADSAITVGAALVLLAEVVRPRRRTGVPDPR